LISQDIWSSPHTFRVIQGIKQAILFYKSYLFLFKVQDEMFFLLKTRLSKNFMTSVTAFSE
jgi:hypothetical protein